MVLEAQQIGKISQLLLCVVDRHVNALVKDRKMDRKSICDMWLQVM